MVVTMVGVMSLAVQPINLVVGIVVLATWLTMAALLWRAALWIFPELLECEPKARKAMFFKAIANNRTGIVIFICMPIIVWIAMSLPNYLPRVFPFFETNVVGRDLKGVISFSVAFLIVFVVAPLLSRRAVREALRDGILRRPGQSHKR